MMKHHDQGNSHKIKNVIGVGLQFRALVHYHHGRKHGSIQEEEVLGKEVIGLYLSLKATMWKLVATVSKEEDQFLSLGRDCALHKSKPTQ